MNAEKMNQHAWATEAYQAWVARFGTPEAYAEKLIKNPEKVLAPLLPHMEDVNGRKILNLMGSNGNKAVALALLGADVTVVDYSSENAAYAGDLAKACGVTIRYEVTDVLAYTSDTKYDFIFAEMGILHYFENLVPFFEKIKSLLTSGGRMVIRDFHPVSTKLIESRGSTAKVRKHKVSGDYFSSELVLRRVAFDKYLSDSDVGEMVHLRLWTLGEIITAVAESGLVIKGLWEAPNQSSDAYDVGIPKTFTLCAEL